MKSYVGYEVENRTGIDLSDSFGDNFAAMGNRLNAHQDMWTNIFNGDEPTDLEGGESDLVKFFGGAVGFISYVGGFAQPSNAVTASHNEALDDFFDERHPDGNIYNEAFWSVVGQEIRNALYVMGWFAYTAPATLILPLLTALNGRMKDMDPLLRPPLTGVNPAFNPISNRSTLRGGRVYFFEPIVLLKHFGTEREIFDPISVPLDAHLTVEVTFNPVILVGE